MPDATETTAEAYVEEPVDVPIDAPEEWESWETKLVSWSIGIGAVALVILGILVNAFILS